MSDENDAWIEHKRKMDKVKEERANLYSKNPSIEEAETSGPPELKNDPEVTDETEINSINKLGNLTQLSNLQYLHPINNHLWWLALMAKISLVMMVLGILAVLTSLA